MAIPATREQVFRRFLSKGLWKASNTSHRATITYMPTNNTKYGILALTHQGKQPATPELVEEIRSREFKEYADNQNRTTNDNMRHTCKPLWAHARKGDSLWRSKTRTRRVPKSWRRKQPWRTLQAVSEQLQHRLVGLLTRCYCRKPIVVKSMPDIACHAEDWDIQRCMFTLVTQIVDPRCVCNSHIMLRDFPVPKRRAPNCASWCLTADVFHKNTAVTTSCSSCDARAFCLAGSALPCNQILTMSSCARVIEGIQKRLVGSVCGHG